MVFKSTLNRNANPVNIKSAIIPVIKQLGLESTLLFEKLKTNWEIIVGSTNAKNTKPLGIENGILTVSVSSPAWITQARFYKSSFIEKINSFDGQTGTHIKDIKFIL